jgi:hypothetical protein
MELFSEDDSDDSLNTSLIDNDSINFENRYQNKHVETLRYLRETLKENKSLRMRLNILEIELEKCHGFDISPLNDRSHNSSLYLRDPDDLIEREVQTDEVLFGVEIAKNEQTDSKHTQTDFSLIEDFDQLTRRRSRFVREVQLSIEINPEGIQDEKKASKELVEIGIQADDNSLESIEQLYKDINHLKIEHEKEIDQLNSNISEIQTECEELKKSIAGFKKSQEVLNEKLGESHKRNMLLINENEQLLEFRRKYEILCVEKEQISVEMDAKHADLVHKSNELNELNERLAQERNKLDEQEKELEHLKVECEKMRKEKHVQCQMRIHELTIESMNQKERLTFLEDENSKHIKLVESLNKQIERLKIEMQSFNFKEFVSLKRELNSLKLEKERHFADKLTTPPNANSTPATHPPLPPIKQQAKKNLFNFFHE